jgi:hypothetical protein
MAEDLNDMLARLERFRLAIDNAKRDGTETLRSSDGKKLDWADAAKTIRDAQKIITRQINAN